jgi:hypothetical protein
MALLIEIMARMNGVGVRSRRGCRLGSLKEQKGILVQRHSVLREKEEETVSQIEKLKGKSQGMSRWRMLLVVKRAEMTT